VEPANFRAVKHDHLVLRQKKRTLVFSDPRQFGRVRFHHGAEAPIWWETSAPEILSREFTQAKMREFVTQHGRAPIKAVLLLQSGFPGVGNWMADEILWRARIAPDRQGSKLTEEQFRALWRSTRFVSRASLRTLGQDNSDPPKGWLLHERWMPGRNCPRDRQKLRRATIGGRTTVWCSRCQR
jgi:formamidopyrimidine-DNA glycosylase